MQRFFSLLSLAFVLAACASPTSAPTVTATALPPTATLTATPSFTQTPSTTPSPENSVIELPPEWSGTGYSAREDGSLSLDGVMLPEVSKDSATGKYVHTYEFNGNTISIELKPEDIKIVKSDDGTEVVSMYGGVLKLENGTWVRQKVIATDFYSHEKLEMDSLVYSPMETMTMLKSEMDRLVANWVAGGSKGLSPASELSGYREETERAGNSLQDGMVKRIDGDKNNTYMSCDGSFLRVERPIWNTEFHSVINTKIYGRDGKGGYARIPVRTYAVTTVGDNAEYACVTTRIGENIVQWVMKAPHITSYDLQKLIDMKFNDPDMSDYPLIWK